MTDKTKLREEVKKVLRSLLISAGDGLEADRVLHDYKEVESVPLPYRQLGYISAQDFFRDIPDVVRIELRYGRMFLRGIADESTHHIQKLVSRQKKKPGPGGLARANQPPSRRRGRFRQPDPPAPLVPAFLKRQIRELLNAYPNGLVSANFSAAFSRRFGREFECLKYGFQTIGDLLRNVQDIVDIEEMKGGGVRLRAKNEESKPWRENLAEPRSTYQAPSKPSRDLDFDSASDSSITNAHDSLDEFDDDGNLSRGLKQDIQKVLLNHPDGVWASQFIDRFQRINSYPLNLKRLGYTSIIDLMSDLPQIVTIDRPNSRDWMLYDANSYKPPPPKQVREEKKAGSESGDFLTKVSSAPQISPTIKETIRQVVAYNPEGTNLSEIPGLYERLTGTPLVVQKLGFASLEMLMVCLLDVIEMRYEGEGKVLVEAINTEIPKENLLKNIRSQHKDRVPADAVGPGVCFETQDLPQENNYVEVYVSNVDNPGNFWLQLKGQYTTSALEDLMDRLEYIYDSPLEKEYAMPDSLVSPGQVAAAVYPQDGNWHRVTIMSVKDQSFVEVYFVDYGNTCCVARGGLRLLKYELMKLPGQALRAKLSNIAPHDLKSWNVRSIKKMLSLVANKPLVALITSIDLDRVMSVCLCDTSGEEDVHINDLLLAEKLAVFKPDALKVQQPPPAESTEAKPLEASPEPAVEQELPLTHALPEEPSTSKPSLIPLVKLVPLDDKHQIHVISFNGNQYAVSGDISRLFWKQDLLRSMLRQKKLNIPRVIIAGNEHMALFQELAKFEVPGVFEESGEMKSHVTLYDLSRLPHLLDVFQHPSTQVKLAVEQILKGLDPQDSFTKGAAEKAETSPIISKPSPRVSPEPPAPAEPAESAEVTLEELEKRRQALQVERKQILQSMMNASDSTDSIQSVEKLNQVEKTLMKLKDRIKKYNQEKSQKNPDQPTSSRKQGAAVPQPKNPHVQSAGLAPSNMNLNAKTNVVAPMPSVSIPQTSGHMAAINQSNYPGMVGSYGDPMAANAQLSSCQLVAADQSLQQQQPYLDQQYLLQLMNQNALLAANPQLNQYSSSQSMPMLSQMPVSMQSVYPHINQNVFPQMGNLGFQDINSAMANLSILQAQVGQGRGTHLNLSQGHRPGGMSHQ